MRFRRPRLVPGEYGLFLEGATLVGPATDAALAGLRAAVDAANRRADDLEEALRRATGRAVRAETAARTAADNLANAHQEIERLTRALLATREAAR